MARLVESKRRDESHRCRKLRRARRHGPQAPSPFGCLAAPIYAISTAAARRTATRPPPRTGWRRGREASAVAGDDLFARLDHHRVGRLSEIVSVRRVESVAEHLSSDPGPDGAASPISEKSDCLSRGRWAATRRRRFGFLRRRGPERLEPFGRTLLWLWMKSRRTVTCSSGSATTSAVDAARVGSVPASAFPRSPRTSASPVGR